MADAPKRTSDYSAESLTSFVQNNFVLILLMIAFFLGGFFTGSLWTENKMLKAGGGVAAAPTAAGAEQPQGPDLSIPTLVAKGVAVGADEAALQKCIDSGETAGAVTEDFDGGQLGGVTGTPGTVVFVDGKPVELISGALPYTDIKPILDKYIDGGAADAAKQAEVAKAPAVTAADHYRGAKDAKIVLVEYSDFECPFCQRFHPTMTQILQDYPTDVAWVYRHYPLSFHPSAQKAAEASECVAKLEGVEAFWEFADSLYE